MDQQLTELLTNYGPIGGIWFDGMWDKPDADWRLERTYALIHRLQPAALIVPNHHKAPLPGEDVQTFEQDLPGANTAGFNTTEIGALPLETSLTMNESWGFNITDTKFKSTRELIGYLVRAAGQRRQPPAQHRSAARRHDPARGRRAAARVGRVAADVWHVDLRNARRSDRAARVGRHDAARRHRLRARARLARSHALDPHVGARVVSASMLGTGERVDMTQGPNGISLTLFPATGDEPDRIVVLQTERRKR